ncbi:hypothetical protein [Amycolatopsis japonica]|uniref:hypothetical protein n=1 Tax=Amycolatopsis japonica TaxID=208439 RepID=UPI0037FCBFF4
MPFVSNVVSVLVASPGDVAVEREAIRATMWDFNDLHAQALQVVLLPTMWETSSRADLGSHPQELLDEQIVDRADIVIGVFWTRIGSLLPDGTAATVHELERVVAASKPALLYFSNQPVVPSSIDADQMQRVTDFKARARGWGLYREYDTATDLVDQLKNDLLRTVRDRLDLPTPEAPIRAATASAHLVAKTDRRESSRVDRNGRLKISHKTYLVVQNAGTETAEDVKLKWITSPDQSEDRKPPNVAGIDETIEYLPPGASVDMPMMSMWGSPTGGVLEITWRNPNGSDGKSRQTVR